MKEKIAELRELRKKQDKLLDELLFHAELWERGIEADDVAAFGQEPYPHSYAGISKRKGYRFMPGFANFARLKDGSIIWFEPIELPSRGE